MKKSIVTGNNSVTKFKLLLAEQMSGLVAKYIAYIC